VIEIAAFLRPVAMTKRHAILRETSQINDDNASLLPDHLYAQQRHERPVSSK